MADATTFIGALVTLVEDADSGMSAATKAKVTLYTGLLGSALNAILPEVNSRIDWSALEASLATGVSGIDAAFKGVEAAIAQAKTTEVATNA